MNDKFTKPLSPSFQAVPYSYSFIHTVDSNKGSHHTETDRQPSGVLILLKKKKKENMLSGISLATDIGGGAKDQG